MNYKEFLSGFPVYSSQNKARKKGYEAHHIIPRSLQTSPDDRCVRLTPFEHIYAHYLLALEDNKAIPVFYAMIQFNDFKLTDDEKEVLTKLQEFARLREEGRESMKQLHAGKHYSPRTEWQKGHVPWIKGKKLSEEQKAKNHKTHKSGMAGRHHSQESIEKIRQGNIGKHDYLNYNPKGSHWYNNGKVSVMAFECPEGFFPGRIYSRKKTTN